MKKKTSKELLAEKEAIIHQILHAIGDDQILEYLTASFEEDRYDLERDIEHEEEYAKFETDSYKSAKSDARVRAKWLRGIMKEQVALQKLLQQVIDTKKAINQKLIDG